MWQALLLPAIFGDCHTCRCPQRSLAQIDSSIGGKTGVNLASGKNLVGAFHQPLAVIIDPLLLSTLPPRQLRSGLYEALKYGVIRSAAASRPR